MVTIAELKDLRALLTKHRLKHEELVTQMQILRQNCQELRTHVRSTSQEHARIFRAATGDHGEDHQSLG